MGVGGVVWGGGDGGDFPPPFRTPVVGKTG